MKTMNTESHSTVSVIVPYYNDHERISRCIGSIISQTRPVDEIVIIDDCSSDSVKLVEFLENHPLIKYFRNNDNKNAAFCRNLGVKMSTGEYVAFLDADDYWEKEHIEVSLKSCISNNADFIYSNVINENDSSKIKYRKVIDHNDYIGESCNILLISPPQTNSFFGCRSLFLDIKFDEKLRRHQDYQLFMDIIESKYKALYIDVYTSYHCVSGRPLRERYDINSTLMFWSKYEGKISNDLYSNYLWLSLYICLKTGKDPLPIINKINAREGRKIKNNFPWNIYCYLYFNIKYRIIRWIRGVI